MVPATHQKIYNKFETQNLENAVVFLTSKIRERMENADFSKHVKNVCKSITLKLQFDFVRFVLRGMNRSGNIFTRLENAADFSETRKCY